MAGRDKTVAVFAVLASAFVWGLIWYPFRVLEVAGLSGARASAFTYGIAFIGSLIFLRTKLPRFISQISIKLVLIGLTAGACNLGYVLATLHGEVMRVLLLFYLAPLWTVLWSRILLAERLNVSGLMVIILSVSGAITMLWQTTLGLPWPSNGAEWLGLVSGVLFAFSNVLARQASQIAVELKSMAIFLGVVLFGVLVMLWMPNMPNKTENLTQLQTWHWGLLLLLGLILMMVNFVVQHGLSQLPANQAIVIFLFELVVAALSSWLLSEETMELQEWLGGAMIITASLFSGAMESKTEVKPIEALTQNSA